jgi:hypothetical protein
MPATVQYKSGYPSTSRAFETSANIASDGLVTGAASFLVPDSSYGVFAVNSAFNQSLIPSLGGARLSGLFVESRSVEKRGGLWIVRVNVVGAVNPPVVERKVDVSPRSLNKSEQRLVNGENLTLSFSFDYSSETTSASTVIARGQNFTFAATTPKVVNIWNRSGAGVISRSGVAGQEEGQATTEVGFVNRQTVIAVYPRALLNETREERAGIVRINKTAQFIYE